MPRVSLCAPDYNRSIYEIIYFTCIGCVCVRSLCVRLAFGFWPYFGLSESVVGPGCGALSRVWLFFRCLEISVRLRIVFVGCVIDLCLSILIWVAYLGSVVSRDWRFVIVLWFQEMIFNVLSIFFRLIKICYNEHRKLIQWIDCWRNIKYPVDVFGFDSMHWKFIPGA